MSRTTRRTLLSALVLLAATAPALAHHGWAWTRDGFFEIKGKVAAMTYANPHPTIDIDVEGETWRVDLATLSATARAGFTESSAKVGDEITAIGNRSRNETEKWMKAVRITVGGKTYDIYPNRVPASN